jgi:hypothetical protein
MRYKIKRNGVLLFGFQSNTQRFRVFVLVFLLSAVAFWSASLAACSCLEGRWRAAAWPRA